MFDSGICFILKFSKNTRKVCRSYIYIEKIKSAAQTLYDFSLSLIFDWVSDALGALQHN